MEKLYDTNISRQFLKYLWLAHGVREYGKYVEDDRKGKTVDRSTVATLEFSLSLSLYLSMLEARRV